MSLLVGAGALMINAVMHIPYLFNDPEEVEAGGGSKLAMSLVPIDMLDYDPFDKHWWWDNLSHFLWGITIGSVLLHVGLPVIAGFLFITALWELYEYNAHERPWHRDEEGEMIWLFDHAMEDTLLDTIMGLAGAYFILLL